MSWKEYKLNDGSIFYLSIREEITISVQYNEIYKNWHYCSWNRNNLDKYLIDTENDPLKGFNTPEEAKKAANNWYIDNFI